MIRILKQIPPIKDLVHRLRNDLNYHLDCGFLVSDSVPSEASFTRMVTKIQQTDVLDFIQTDVLVQAFTEGFLTEDTVAIDETHIEARDRSPSKQEKAKEQPKRRGRNPKAKQEAWLQSQTEKEAALPIYEIRSRLSSMNLLKD